MANFFEGYRYHVTGLNHGTDGFPVNASPRIHTDELRLIRKVEANKADIVKFEEYHARRTPRWRSSPTASPGGPRKRRSRRPGQEGIKAGLFRPLTIWPFPEEQVAALSGRVKAIVVPELSLGQIIFEVERCAKGRCTVEGIYRVDGDPINPAQILAKVKEVM